MPQAKFKRIKPPKGSPDCAEYWKRGTDIIEVRDFYSTKRMTTTVRLNGALVYRGSFEGASGYLLTLGIDDGVS